MLRDLFDPDEVDKICSLILCPRIQRDTLIWQGTRSGEFSVCSASHLAVKIRDQSKGACSSGEQVESYWNKLWRIRGPKVVQTFMWKVSQNIFPTKANLF